MAILFNIKRKARRIPNEKGINAGLTPCQGCATLFIFLPTFL